MYGAPRKVLVGGLVAALFGCGSANTDDTPNVGTGQGGGGSTTVGMGGQMIGVPTGGGAGGNDPNGGGVGGGMCDPQPIGLLRDFSPKTSPDFEYVLGDDKGLVAMALGGDKKPVFAGAGHPTVHTAAEFDTWYRDTAGVNMTSEFKIPFTNDAASGHLVYDNAMFFPLDRQGLGNENRNHNFHFTFELHMEFKYSGGEVFNFRGDDDVFVFVNNQLAIDLGGVHSAEVGQLDLDQQATALGISPGNVYPIDFFQAERHTTQSSFRIETSLVFSNCKPIIVR
jgi:fibro-slime domain-containing protein